ncbi:MAG: ATP phosphoribosyltransferase regulatory subunit [Clostridia bacterium]|nr:ATP phosphoribosyltransferase regulatory subunit [Clostridia bacterium]
MRNLRADERISIELRDMYQQHGYLPYKVNQFEEYDLYMRNKRFLISENVLAFSDMDGKLMAMKPDVTLSIIKNSGDSEDITKVSYAERVYRVPRGAKGFKEIMQTGLEVIGRVDAVAMGEVLMLAARSLEAISADYALDIADLGIVSGILGEAELSDDKRAQLLALIRDKNLHGLKALCGALGLDERTKQRLCSLVTVYGPFETTLPVYEQMDLPAACGAALCDLRTLLEMTKACGVKHINLDFSVVSDMNYYNGLVFSGFVCGVPQSVLSGGRYDYLMRRMGRKSQAMGFAVYLDQLERLLGEKREYDVDLLILYGEAAKPADVLLAAQRAKEKGLSVRVQRAGETAVRAREVMTV